MSTIIVLPGREDKIGKATRCDADHIFIYALVDPREKAVCYIGRSKNLKRRFTQHKNEPWANHKIYDWITSLFNDDLEPYMIILDLVHRSAGWKAERKWIWECLKREWPLFNVHGVPKDWRASCD